MQIVDFIVSLCFNLNVAYKLQKNKGCFHEKNVAIRDEIGRKRIKYWEVAEKVGISDGRLSVWLRTPLSDERRKRVEKAIDELSQSIKQ